MLGGSWSGALGGKLGEVWSPTASWRELPSVPADPIYTADAEGVYRADNHGWFIATLGRQSHLPGRPVAADALDHHHRRGHASRRRGPVARAGMR